GDLDPQTLVVPDTGFQDQIAELAREVTEGTTNRLEQASALQAYLRDTSRFTYSTEGTPAASRDAVWDFLQSRSGYCVQFATAMVVMARTLGIPARVGVGYLPGDFEAATSSYLVLGRAAHAWPELYFPRIGWLRFEPTPAIQSGAPPEYTTLPGSFPT